MPDGARTKAGSFTHAGRREDSLGVGRGPCLQAFALRFAFVAVGTIILRLLVVHTLRKRPWDMRYQRCGWYQNSVEAYLSNPELPHTYDDAAVGNFRLRPTLEDLFHI